MRFWAQLGESLDQATIGMRGGSRIPKTPIFDRAAAAA